MFSGEQGRGLLNLGGDGLAGPCLRTAPGADRPRSPAEPREGARRTKPHAEPARAPDAPAQGLPACPGRQPMRRCARAGALGRSDATGTRRLPAPERPPRPASPHPHRKPLPLPMHPALQCHFRTSRLPWQRGRRSARCVFTGDPTKVGADKSEPRAQTAGVTDLQKTGCERDSPLPTGAEPGGARSCCGVGTGGGAGPRVGRRRALRGGAGLRVGRPQARRGGGAWASGAGTRVGRKRAALRVSGVRGSRGSHVAAARSGGPGAASPASGLADYVKSPYLKSS
ncbi:translation initiation factor IF-2-like [Lutra lutra]|uniref:translation initiation factor IF-2-like n=1 Tax=Lutra lutra TaxID=9657 RepID=UPI001FD04506|nr:translation initiation factor IF-2-like [Lutra lutra]